MLGKHVRRPSPALVVALLALFVALGGTAAAAKVLITSAQIKDGTIRLVDINKQARKQFTRGPTNIAARVYGSHDQPSPLQIAFAPVKRVAFDSISFDTADMFNLNDPTRLTAPVDGVYLISTSISWQVSSTQGRNRAVYVYVDGNVVAVDQRPPAEETRQVVTIPYELNAGDYVEVGAAQDEADSLSVNAVGDYAPSLSLVWIAPG